MSPQNPVNDPRYPADVPERAAGQVDPFLDNAPAVHNEPLPAHLDENRDIFAEAEEPAAEAVPPAKTTKPKVKGSFAGGTWAALIIGALLLIALLVFILQNQQAVELNLLTWTFEFPAGIGYLFSAIAGALIMALVGGVRMLELRRQVKKQAKR